MAKRLTHGVVAIDYQDGSEADELAILLDGEPVAIMLDDSADAVKLARILASADESELPE